MSSLQQQSNNNSSSSSRKSPLGQQPASDVFARPPPDRNLQHNSNSTTGGNHHPFNHPLSPSRVDFELPERSSVAPRVTNTLPPPPEAPVRATAGKSSTSPTPSATARGMSLDDLADAFLSASSPWTVERALPPILAPDPLPAEASDFERLKILVHRRAWAEVLLYTNVLRTGPSSHYAPLYEALVGYSNNASAADLALETHKQDLVYILSIHVTALVKLGKFKELAQEIERWTFCHHRQNSSGELAALTAPTWIPWSLHILAATTLQYGDGKDNNTETACAAKHSCVEALWSIRKDIPIDQTAALVNVENALQNVFIALKEWRMALECLQRMIDLSPAAATAELAKILLHKPMCDSCSLIRTVADAYRSELLSRQGRLLLQAGALDQAATIFQQARLVWNNLDDAFKTRAMEYEVIQFVPAQLLANEGMLKFSYGKYEEALESFRATAQYFRGGTDEISCRADHPMEDRRSSLYSETINNIALCALYTCRLQEALQLMESLVREDVTAYLTERVALNLCTLYELSTDSTASMSKKRVLQLIARRFSLQDIRAESFRVS